MPWMNQPTLSIEETDEGRARMMAQTDRIEEPVEDAGRKAAAL
jgi:hypothetical protein